MGTEVHDDILHGWGTLCSLLACLLAFLWQSICSALDDYPLDSLCACLV